MAGGTALVGQALILRRIFGYKKNKSRRLKPSGFESRAFGLFGRFSGAFRFAFAGARCG